MSDAPSLELPDESRGAADETGAVPPPLPPDDPEAWYARDVRAQYEVHPGVVATIEETDDGFSYDAREPLLGPGERTALDRVEAYFADANLGREGKL